MSESLYRDLLLDHMRHPRFAGKVEPADRTASAYNPLCGDELELTLALTGDCIREARAQVRGCSVCVASASMMGAVTSIADVPQMAVPVPMSNPSLSSTPIKRATK